MPPSPRGSRRCAGDALPLYAGCDDCILPVLALGGRGAVSVASNLYPDTVTALCRAYRAGDTAQARRPQADLLPPCEALFADVNPIPVKAALAGLGLCRDVLRLPLTPAGGGCAPPGTRRNAKGRAPRLKGALPQISERLGNCLRTAGNCRGTVRGKQPKRGCRIRRQPRKGDR